MDREKYYLFVDTETTGLNYNDNSKVAKNVLLEIAYILTDSSLVPLMKDSCVIGYTPADIDDLMNDYVYDMHSDNGLLDEVYESTLTRQAVDNIITTGLETFFNDRPYKLIIAGNTVHFDKEIIRRELPHLHSLLHFRNLDVSSVREYLCISGNEELTNQATDKKFNHRAMDDIEETIEELSHYLDFIGAEQKNDA